MAALSLSLLGPFAATYNNQPLHNFKTHKVQALLIYLAVEKDHSHRQESLTEFLWPDMPLESAQVNLRQTIYHLQQAIPKVQSIDGKERVRLVMANQRLVGLNPRAAVQADVLDFQVALADDPVKAVSLYRGDFLEDFNLLESNPFEEWAQGIRENLRRTMLSALDGLVETCLAGDDYADAQTYAWRQLEIDPLHERAYRQLMTALASSGQRNAVISLYQLCKNRLAKELGSEPSPETTQLYEQIRAEALRQARKSEQRPQPAREGMPVFLLTDIEGSTRMWDTYRQAMLPALLQHNQILETCITRYGGRILELRGDGVKAVFEGVNPLQCMLDIQQSLGTADWGEVGDLRIRMGLHGVPTVRKGFDYFIEDEKYYGPVLNHTARIMDAGHGGQILVSDQVHQKFNLPPGASWRDFGLHTVKSLDHPIHIYGLLHPDLPLQSFPPLRTGSAQAEPEPDKPALQELTPTKGVEIRHNLPHPLTSFIGRQEELDKITDFVENYRLVALTGAGGIGKTQLCVHAGRKLLDHFPDGVWLVELAPVADADFLPQTVAYALGLRDTSSRPILERLLEFLQDKRVLLILDNCEHLIEASAQFAKTILQACPETKILATSREALGVSGEMPFLVPSLAFPQDHKMLSVDEWEQYDALQLFVERAATVLPDFQVTQENLTPLVQICQQLDGVPLALELAAARVQILTIEQIASRLDDRFHLLTGGRRTALPRLQTLQASIEWSWDLLSPAEQDLMRRLSIFAGGMQLEAVEAICDGQGVEACDALVLLTQLVNKSMVVARRQQGLATRYWLLDTIQQYAWEQLIAAGQEDKYRDRHLAYFEWLGKQAQTALVGPDQVVWLNRLERELDNIRTALRWAHETDIEAGLRLVTSTWRFWEFDYKREADAWLSQFLVRAEPLEPGLKAQALWIRAYLNCKFQALQKINIARQAEEESLALYQKLGDQQGIARCLALPYPDFATRERRKNHLESLAIFKALGDKLGQAEVLVGLGLDEWKYDYELAMDYLKESESLFRELGHVAGIALVLSDLALIKLYNEEFESARQAVEESLTLYESLGMRGSRFILNILGELHFRQGDYQQALDNFERSLKMSQRFGDELWRNWAFIRIGNVYLEMGEIFKAREIFLQSLHQFEDVGHTSGVIFSTERLVSLVLRQGQAQKAARLIGWADAAREAIENIRPPIEQTDVDQDIAAIIELIGEEAYAVAYAKGQIMTMEQAISLT